MNISNSSVKDPLGDETIAEQIVSVLVSVMTGLVVFSLGCTVDVWKLLGHIRKPQGVLVGFLCQFGIMPLTGFLLSLVFNLKPAHAVVTLITGCCPGGISSNIFTACMDGDIDLSITMTGCSTVLALGMMPLCLLVYSQYWVHTGNISIPYSTIGLTLATLLVPVACGVLVNHKWPKAAKIFLRVGLVIGPLIYLIAGIFSTLKYPGSWHTDTAVLIVSTIFPVIGYGMGFTISVLLRQPWHRCRTIAMETGAQNIQVCFTVIQLSFAPKLLEDIVILPIIYSISQGSIAFLLTGAFQIHKRTHVPKSQHPVSSPETQNGSGVTHGHEVANTVLEQHQMTPVPSINPNAQSPHTYL
ncbi:ileal sodium/bile acid cotransporter-like isoform X1 [Denticeps clupeoides]|uniref:ileal sodium/bile acid cotransporter-like isoform X1 n=1 Tax=Denticeps clupeoides TaxID=299321 RepID=UPI0010A4351F|nr:ileal sodium/bile acid cotransporter-like isoform X1 [Denticeps clupeoides]